MSAFIEIKGDTFRLSDISYVSAIQPSRSRDSRDPQDALLRSFTIFVNDHTVEVCDTDKVKLKELHVRLLYHLKEV